MNRRVVLSWLLCLGLLVPLWSVGCSGSDDMCGAGSQCTLQGLCGWVDGKCAPRSDQDCENSEFCERHGECKSSMGRCIAETDAQCRNSVFCKRSGLCLARKGECVQITEGYCQTHSDCTSIGKCSLNPTYFLCEVSSTADCQKSDLCKKEQKCIFEDSRCVITDDVCKASDGCKKDGLCGRQGSRCLALKDEDCADSVACRVESRCKAEYGVCVNPAAETSKESPEEATNGAEGVPEGDAGTTPEDAPEEVPESPCYRVYPSAPCSPSCNPADGVVVGSTCAAGTYCQFSSLYKPGYCRPFPRDAQKNGRQALGAKCSNTAASGFCNGPDGLVCVNTVCVKACNPRQGVRSNPLCQSGEFCLNAVEQSHLGGICQSQYGPPTQQIGDSCGNGIGERCIEAAVCVSKDGESRCQVRCSPTSNTCPVGASCKITPDKQAYYCETPATRRLGQTCNVVNQPCLPGLVCISETTRSICFQRCDPKDPTKSPCPATLVCLSDSLGRGYCAKKGTQTVGQTCDPITSRCLKGLTCLESQTGSFCRQSCDPDQGNSCPVGQFCYSFSGGYYCGKPLTQNEGEQCDALDNPCLRGLTCISFRGSGTAICHKVCDRRGQDTCPATSACVSYDTSLDVCQPIGNQAEGSVCDYLRGCLKGLVCRPVEEKGESICMQMCDPQKLGECREGFECAPEGYCRRQGTQKDLLPCDAIARRCVDGLGCKSTKYSEPVCLRPCNPNRTPSPCTDGRACLPLSPDVTDYYCLPLPNLWLGRACDNINRRCPNDMICLGDKEAAYCHQLCDPNKQASCPQNFDCVQDTGGSYYCKALPSQKLGEPCDFAKTCVTGMICRGPSPGNQVCYQKCDPNATGACPEGFVCEADNPPYCKREPTQSMGQECDPYVLRCKDGMSCNTFFDVVPQNTCKKFCDPRRTGECPNNYFCARLNPGSNQGVCRNKQSKALGLPCNFTTDPCAPGMSCIRVKNQGVAQNYCTQFCDPRKSGECSSGAVCDFDSSGVGVCLKAATQKEGESCDAVINRCVVGLVCQADGTESQCLKPCQSSSKCKSTQECTTLQPNSTLKFCFDKQAGGRKLSNPCNLLDKRCGAGLICLGSPRTCHNYCDPFQGIACPPGFSCAREEQGFFCQQEGVQQEGDFCSSSLRCLPGLTCAVSFGKSACVKTCNPNDKDPCAEGKLCQQYDATVNQYFCLTPPLKKLQESCNHIDQRCQSGQTCLGDAKKADGRCFQLCDPKNSSACASGFTCRKETKSGLNLCVKDGTQLIDERCDGNLQCVANLYCTDSVGYRFCMKPCDPTNTATQCDRTRTCQRLYPGSADFYCLLKPTQKAGDVCDGVAKRCLDKHVCIGNTTDARCYRLCNTEKTNDCPPDFTCSRFAASKSTYCIKQGKQDVGDPCSVDNLCKPGLICVESFGKSACRKQCDPTQKGQCTGGTSCQRFHVSSSAFFCFEPPAKKEGESCDVVKERCSGGLICLGTTDNKGQCFRSCTLGQSNTCPSGSQCISVSKDFSICRKEGGLVEGSRCNQTKDCLKGLECKDNLGERLCLQPCDPKASPSTCTNSQTCQPYTPLDQKTYCLPQPYKASGQSCNLVKERCVKGAYCFGSAGAAFCRTLCGQGGSAGNTCGSTQSCHMTAAEEGYCVAKGTVQAGGTCSLSKPCADNLFCRDAFGQRTCLKKCNPNVVTSCSGTQSCQPIDVGSKEYYCFEIPSQSENEQCSVTKRCNTGMDCPFVFGRYTCVKPCDTNNPCTGNRVCQPDSPGSAKTYCMPKPTQTIGQNCSTEKLCLSGLECRYSQGDYYCLKPCDINKTGECSSTRKCEPLFEGATQGYCLTPAKQKEGQPCDGVDLRCLTGRTCLRVNNETPVCLLNCEPQKQNSCPSTAQCTQASDGRYFCVDVGTAKDGEACQVTDDCVPGLVCFQGPDATECLRRCNVQSPSCPGGRTCRTLTASSTDYYCLPAPSQKAGEECGVTRNICLSGLRCILDRLANKSRCRAQCFPAKNQKCAAGETCLTFSSGDGYCLRLRKEFESCSNRSAEEQCGPGTRSQLQCIQGTCLESCDIKKTNQCLSGRKCQPVVGASSTLGTYCIAPATRQLGQTCDPIKQPCVTKSQLNPNVPEAECVGGICLQVCAFGTTIPCASPLTCQRYSEFVSKEYCLPVPTRRNYETCNLNTQRCISGRACLKFGTVDKCYPICDPSRSNSCPTGTKCSNEAGHLKLCTEPSP